MSAPLSKPKILHTMTWLAPGGGVDLSVATIIEKLGDKYEFHLLHGRVVNENVLTAMKNLPRHQCDLMFREIKPFNDLQAIWWIYRHLKSERYDVVHTHEAKASLLTRIAAWFAGTSVLIFGLEGVTYNDPMSNLRRKILILAERMTVWMNDYVISVGRETIEDYHKQGIGRTVPYSVIHSGLDLKPFIENATSHTERTAFRENLGLGSEDILWINVGRFSSSKAQHYLISALAELKDELPKVKLLLVGEGECLEECREQAIRLGLGERVIFYGYSNEVPKLLQCADLFAMSSLREGLPRVIVEASLAKLPTCAFEVEGAKEVITNGQNGFIVPSKNMSEFCAKLRLLSTDKNLRETFGQRAFDFCADKWDEDKTIGEIDEIYKSCLSNSR